MCIVYKTGVYLYIITSFATPAGYIVTELAKIDVFKMIF